MRDHKLWVSLLILAVIGLHALPVLDWQGYRQTRWPFLAWAMYARSYPPGPIEIIQRRIVATSSTNSELEVTAAVVGLPRPTFRNLFANPLATGDSVQAAALLDRLNAELADSIVRLRVETVQYRLTDTGVVEQELPAVVYGTPATDPAREARP